MTVAQGLSSRAKRSGVEGSRGETVRWCNGIPPLRSELQRTCSILIREIRVIRGFFFCQGGVKNPREGSAEEISFPWDLRYGHGIGRGGAKGARIQSHRVGRKYVSAHVDVSPGKGHLIERGVSR